MIDTLQRDADASYRPAATGAAPSVIARNRAHGLEATFAPSRVEVAMTSDERQPEVRPLTLSASAIAIDGRTLPLHGERKTSSGDREAYAHAPAADVQFDEWFRNGPLGLQQGFDVKALPDGARDLALSIDVGDWMATLADSSGDVVALRRAGDDADRLAYRHVRAWDRTGRFLPAHLEAADHTIRLAVSIRDAELPITIDPLLQQAILTPGIATPGGGVTVAVRGNRALIGAPFTTVGSNAQQGVVYVYQRSATTGVWSLQSTVSDGAGHANDWFGYSVALGDFNSGAIGAPQADPAGVQDGGQVFRLSITSGTGFISELDSPRATNDLFGWSVAAEGDTIVASAEQDTGTAFGQGSVEVWGYAASDGESFVRKATLFAPGAASLDHFGFSVAISGDTLVVGAPDVDLVSPARENVGAVYVYTYYGPGDTYLLQARLDRPGTGVACENFGGSVAISGERIVVGSGISASNCSPGGPNVSQVHEFTRSGTTWGPVTSFTPSDCTSAQVCQGTRVALAASLLTVGLQFEIVNGVQTGTVKAYRRTTSGWSAFQRLPAPGLIANSRAGIWVATSATYALAGVLGAPGQTGFAPIFGPSPGDLVPAIGDGVIGDFGSVNGWRQRLNRPFGLAVDGSGHVIVADTYNQRLKDYDPILDAVTFRAGTGVAGASGDDSFAGAAQLSFPTDVAVDGSGRISIADSGNNKIRRISATSIISTLGGTGVAGFAGDGGPATSAQFDQPYGIGVDGTGNVYVADTNNHRVRRIDAATNIVTTIAGTGVAGYNGDGIAATSAQLAGPRDVAIAPDGSIYIADTGNTRVRRINPANGQMATVLGTGTFGFNGDGLAGPVTQISAVEKIAFDAAGNLYVADLYNHRARRVTGGNGLVSTIAGTGVSGTSGDGGPATSAELRYPYAVAVAPTGTYIVEQDGTTGVSQVRRIEAAGLALSYTRAGTGLGNVSIDPPGLVCASSCNSNFASGTIVTLVASPAATSTFNGWSGDCSGTGTCTVTMSQARNVSATFTGNPQLLTVNRSGTGAGTVTSAPPGISCGADCNEIYPYNTSVTLTATAGVNSTFTGWTGDCTGAGACVVAMNQARTVTAQFVPIGTPPTITSRSPARGSTQGGTVVVLTGQNFVTGTTARVGALTVPVLLGGTTQLSFVTPAATAAGVQTITVQTSSGQATTLFEYAAPTYETHEGWRRPAFAIDRYVAFETGLPLLPDDTNGVSDIYVHDDVTDTLHRVSVSTVGREAIGGESSHAAISATGRFIAFESLAANLVYGDTNGLSDVFLHDRDADENGVFDELGGISTVRISVSSAGLQAIGGGSAAASISGNGRFVAFQSSATNLVSGDANGVADVFVHDRLLGSTVRESIATDGTTATAADSARPAISQNGRFVAFDSAAVLTAGDTNAARDVFVHDRDRDGDGVMDEAGAVETRRISIASTGAQALGGDSVDPSITGDGRYIVFASWATTLVPGDTNHVSDVFLQDRDVDGDGVFDEPGQIVTRRVTVGAGGAQFTVASGTPRISANGKLLVFLVATSTSAPVVGGVAAADVASDPGKSAPWTQPDPTNPSPTPPGKSTPAPGPDPAPNTDTGDVSTSPDGDEWGGTDTTDGPKVVIVEEPDEPDPTPAIVPVSPGQGSSLGGTLITIEGRDLAGTLYWNDAPLATKTRTPTTWTAVTPPKGAGPATATIYIQVADRRSERQLFTYNALSTPRLTLPDPPPSGSVSGGSTLLIAGSGFDAVPTARSRVRLGRAAATVRTWTANSIAVTVPEAYVAGPVPVVVTNDDGGEVVSEVPFTYTSAAGPVSVARVDPQIADITGGTAVTILGTGFVPGTTVTFGGRPGTSLQMFSSNTLVVDAPSGVPGAVTLTVAVPGQPAVDLPFRYQPPPVTVVGCTGPDNDGDGMDDAWEAQFGLVAGDPGDGASDPDNDGRTSAQECMAGTHPRGTYTRYLAEGATGTFFETRILLANPGSTPARVLLRFQTSMGDTPSEFLLIPAMSRRTVRAASVPGLAAAEFSTIIESDVEVVVDRTMLWGIDAASGYYGSHAESSLSSPRTDWYLAEGATSADFRLYYLLQNPSSTPTVVRVRYLRPGGVPPIERDYTVAPLRRLTISVNEVPGLGNAEVSAAFTSLNGVPYLVERAMYLSQGRRAFESGHESAAVESLSTHWFLAEGATGPFFDAYILLANPNDTAANVAVSYLLSSGATIDKTYQLAPNSRTTIDVKLEAPQLASAEVSTVITVTNNVPIVVERAMWWPSAAMVNAARPIVWGEAHNAQGATATGTKWAVADGETGGNPDHTHTYVLIANTSSFAADVSVTLLGENGQAPVVRHFAVAASSRFTVDMNRDFPHTDHDGDRTYGAIIESHPVGGQAPAQIVVERAMYSDAGGIQWAAGTDLLATRLR